MQVPVAKVRADAGTGRLTYGYNGDVRERVRSTRRRFLVLCHVTV